MKKALFTTLRLGLTGATVAGIGWAFITLSPPKADTPVQEQSLIQESQADIFGMSFAAPNRTQKFMESLERLGHEPPRAYDANGNSMFFSTAVTHKMPEQILREYQQEFVNQGLNSEIYTQSPFALLGSDEESTRDRAFKMLDAAMKGEMIPQIVSKDHVSIGGANMHLPEDEFADKPEETFGKKTDLVVKANEHYMRAYKLCRGDMAIYEQELEAQRKAKAEKAELSTLQDITARIDQAAQTNTSCNGSSGGMCSPESEALDQTSMQASALQEALAKQPELQSCPELQVAHRTMASSTFKDARQRIRALRYIEAIRDQNSQTTSVTAVWSDEDMDPKKFMTETFGYDKSAKVRGDFPVCPGCRRTWNFGGTSTEKDYITDTLVSGDSIGRVSEYYTRELNRQGWQLSDSSHKSAELMQVDGVRTPTRHLHFQRDGKFMTVRIGQDENGQTEILSNTSD